MRDVVNALREQQQELATRLDTLEDAGWRRPSACAGWSVLDVVLHLAQTDEMAIASATGTLPPVATTPAPGAVDRAADEALARERGAPPASVLERWHRGAGQLCEALLACEPSARVEWVAGTLAARTLATTRIAETWIHTGDVFHAFGDSPAPTDRLWHVARLAHRTLPYAFAQAGRSLTGPVSFRLQAPSGAAWDLGPESAPTVISGPGADLCRVAARRVPPSATALGGEGPDYDAVLELVRTWA